MILPVEMAVISTTVTHPAVGFWGVWGWVGGGGCVLLGLFVVGLGFFREHSNWKYRISCTLADLSEGRGNYQNFLTQTSWLLNSTPPAPSSCWCYTSYHIGTQDQSKPTTDLVTRLLKTEMSTYQGTQQLWRSFSFSPDVGTADLPWG